MERPATTRLHVETDLGGGGTVTLGRDQAHYLRAVLRLQAGARVLLFNGRDGEWLAAVAGTGKGAATLELMEQARPQAEVTGPSLLFAPIKKGPMDFLVQKAVELGVSALHPVMTQRTNVSRVNLDRLWANAREAAEQCGRLTVPDVIAPASLDAVLAGLADGTAVLWCAESGEANPIAEALAPLSSAHPIAFITGPEGGFSPSELDALRNNALITPISLGPRILRAETAALAALACWQSVHGDWHNRPPGLAGTI